ncbi:MAG: DUF2075 domain-containing protein, partial [Candidatus Sumerlaeaceae bacterium]|nr:DUF2075 domain-containing protein [Candidatus Sumerlaeaceae bacterium]
LNMSTIDPQVLTLSASSRAYYADSIQNFLCTAPATIIGQLAQNSAGCIRDTETGAWQQEIGILKSSLADQAGMLYLEFCIPRMGRRIDAVLIIGPVVFVVEFKVGARQFDRAAIEQVWDYALDLKNFHEGSHHVPIVPIVVATEATLSTPLELVPDWDNVYRPVRANALGLRMVIEKSLRSISGTVVDSHEWIESGYKPTPTIVEAARALYAHHSVDAIARYDAGAENLRITSARLETIVEEARRSKRKAICFVTGVPGAGKTLVGLNLATQRQLHTESSSAVFLSGNGPLVEVLREALTRDEHARQKGNGNKVRKGEIRERVKAFIQNVHHFRDEALVGESAPVEHVVIFDEAQRAWNHIKTVDFMRRKKNRPNFACSEPEFLIRYMDRHTDWSVIVCLVGGGQEINTGEAGIEAWLDAVRAHFGHWTMHISSRLTDSEYCAGRAVEVARRQRNVKFEDCLHLAVSMRSFRAEHVSSFVKALLDLNFCLAHEMFDRLADRYPLVVTRDLNAAKSWIRSRARGSERYGMVTSSKALRLKPHAIDVRVDVNPIHYFLNDPTDTRSSFYLEDAATEFQVQGLELDWVCVAWDGDLRFTGSEWSYHNFRGDKWQKIRKEDNRRYLLNAYRVLLTRARQGMVIFVPSGDSTDPTRKPVFYDQTFKLLKDSGIPVLA